MDNNVIANHIADVIDTLVTAYEDQEEILDIIEDVVDAWRRHIAEVNQATEANSMMFDSDGAGAMGWYSRELR